MFCLKNAAEILDISALVFQYGGWKTDARSENDV